MWNRNYFASLLALCFLSDKRHWKTAPVSLGSSGSLHSLSSVCLFPQIHFARGQMFIPWIQSSHWVENCPNSLLYYQFTIWLLHLAGFCCCCLFVCSCCCVLVWVLEGKVIRDPLRTQISGGILWMSYSRGWYTFFCKLPESQYFMFCGSFCLL